MSNFFDGFLNSAFGADGYMQDFQHASRLYRSERFYDLAPKAGWLYYVRFNLNTANPYISGIIDQTWRKRQLDRNTIGLLAKSVDLPKFNISSETVNQYNRKTLVQTKLTYSPISIAFHDDMANATADFWKHYYKYMVADGNAGRSYEPDTGAVNSENFSDNKYLDKTYDYGLSNGQQAAGYGGFSSKFINSIEIYQLNKKKYNGMILVNPIIKDWSHGSLAQNSNTFLENRMSIEYETVFYKKGKAKDTGFTDNFYDKTPSPNQVGGNLFGAGGVINGAVDVFGDLSEVNANTNPLDLIQIGLKTAALARNIPTAIQGAEAELRSLAVNGILGLARGANYTNYADQLSNNPDYSGFSRVGEQINLYRQNNSKGSTNATQV